MGGLAFAWVARGRKAGGDQEEGAWGRAAE
jgi:hypothetical protein